MIQAQQYTIKVVETKYWQGLSQGGFDLSSNSVSVVTWHDMTTGRTYKYKTELCQKHEISRIDLGTGVGPSGLLFERKGL